jgi:chromosomal replication initiator protein
MIKFNTWIKPLAPLGIDTANNAYVIAVPNSFKLQWIREQYLNKINDLAKYYLPEGVQS